MLRFLAILAFIGIAGCARAPSEASIPYHEVIDHPQRFSGRAVVIDGVWARFDEHSFLRDVGQNAQPRTWVRVDSTLTKEEETALSRAYEKINAWEEKKEKVVLRVKLRGIFRFRPNSAFRSGFGHVSEYESELAITEILEMKQEPNQPPEPTAPSGRGSS